MGRRRNARIESSFTPQTARLLDRLAGQRADSASVKRRGVEQSAARQPHSLEVAGSSPAAAIDHGYVRHLRKLYPPPYDPTPQPSDWRRT